MEQLKKVEILFPQIVLEAKTIELTQQEIDDFFEMGTGDMAEFIWSKLDDTEQGRSTGIDGIEWQFDTIRPTSILFKVQE